MRTQIRPIRRHKHLRHKPCINGVLTAKGMVGTSNILLHFHCTMHYVYWKVTHEIHLVMAIRDFYYLLSGFVCSITGSWCISGKQKTEFLEGVSSFSVQCILDCCLWAINVVLVLNYIFQFQGLSVTIRRRLFS